MQIRSCSKPRTRRSVALGMLVAAILFVLSAGVAYAGYYGQTWLNWGSVGGGRITYTGFTHLKQVGTEPRNYDWGCGNMWNGANYVFSEWYCGNPGYARYSPDLSGIGVSAEPVAWNDNPSEQQLWAWEYYYA